MDSIFLKKEASDSSICFEEDYPYVDIITINYNSKIYIDGYIESLSKIDYPFDRLKVFILDNGSHDDSWRYLEESVEKNGMKNIVFLKLDVNTGFTGANNIGFRLSNADYVLLLNIDTEIKPDCLKLLVEKMNSDQKIGIVEAKQVPNEHPKQYNLITGETAWSSGACCLIRKKALRDTGYFDERFFLYCEDVDLSWRMWSCGWKCVYLPDAECKHYTLDLAKHKSGSYTEFRFSMRNGLFMYFIYGTVFELLMQNMRLFKLLFSNGFTKIHKKHMFMAFLAEIKNFFYLLRRRKIFRKYGLRSKYIKFYGWDYAEHKKQSI